MSGGAGEQHDTQLDTRDNPEDAAACKADWEAVVARAGLASAYEVTTRPVRLPDSRRRGARFTIGVFLRLRPGVTPDAASRAALQAAMRARVPGSG